MTNGAIGPYLLFPQLLDDLDMLREVEVYKPVPRFKLNNNIIAIIIPQAEASSDPNVLKGTPCCPGVVDGSVRVVTNIEQAKVCINISSSCDA